MSEQGFDQGSIVGGTESTPPSPKIDKITVADLRPEVPQVGGSVIVLQRNAKDKDGRKLPVEDPNFGALDPGEAEKTRTEAKDYFDNIFTRLSEDERKTVDMLVVASDSTLSLPDGRKSSHKRAVETGDEVLAGIRASMTDFAISQKQLLNGTGSAMEITNRSLADLHMLEDSPDFVKFLMEKYGPEKFWVAYESDAERETRIKMGAEGPVEIANRVRYSLGVLANVSRIYHEEHPGRRLVIWAVSHYDSISPFIKRHVVKMDDNTFLNTYLPVDNRAGIVSKVGQDGTTTTDIQKQTFNVTL